jgi:hypothetical protein
MPSHVRLGADTTRFDRALAELQMDLRVARLTI